jgi:hypothetical protein
MMSHACKAGSRILAGTAVAVTVVVEERKDLQYDALVVHQAEPATAGPADDVEGQPPVDVRLFEIDTFVTPHECPHLLRRGSRDVSSA